MNVYFYFPLCSLHCGVLQTTQGYSSKPFVCFPGSLVVKTHEINHEGNYHLSSVCSRFLGWTVSTEEHIWLLWPHASRWGFWDRPRRSHSRCSWHRASGASVSLPLSMPPSSCPVFWFGWVGCRLSLPNLFVIFLGV